MLRGVRDGENGKGFAVVGREVRNLAVTLSGQAMKLEELVQRFKVADSNLEWFG